MYNGLLLLGNPVNSSFLSLWENSENDSIARDGFYKTSLVFPLIRELSKKNELLFFIFKRSYTNQKL
jgi:hypothetical protein